MPPLRTHKSLSRRGMTKQMRNDILLSIKPIHMANIASRKKNHEFRKYLIPASVKRMWFYTTAPIQCVRYIAIISNGKKPGEINMEDMGLGNDDFNAGKKESKYGYEILHLYELHTPLSLQDLVKRGFTKGAPQKYLWVMEEMINSVPLEMQRKLF